MQSIQNLKWLAVLACAAPVGAQTFSYPDFNSTAGLTLNGNATTVAPVLRVTPSLSGMTSSVLTDQAVNVNGSFDTSFAFQITQLINGGADGLAFVIANDPRGATAMGDGGTSMGYGWEASSPPTAAIANSLVIEIDTWLSTGDLSANEISVQTGGNAPNSADGGYSIGRISPATNMSDGQVHVMRISYLAGSLRVYLDDLLTPLLNVAYDFNSGGTWVASGTPVGGLALINGSSAHVGFSSATGGAWENHDVLWWNWSSCSAGVRYCTAKINSLGCTPVIGSIGSPSATAGFGFIVNGTNMRNNKNGLLFYGVSGRSSLPFQGGTLCVKTPLKRTGSTHSGGTPAPANDCSGVFAIDMNLFAVSTGTPLPLAALTVPGSVVTCQWWGRDPGFPAPNNTQLSDGLEYTVCP
jgi:hypothetical protein